MSLFNGLGLLWLLLVPALVILYMFRPKRLRKPVSSLRLWQAMPQMERSRARLRRPPLSLLLILQAIALAAGAFALAQPALTAPAGRHTVVVMDASGSMQALENGQSRFDKAKDEAGTLITKLAGQDRLTLLRAGVHVTTACAECTREEAQRSIAALTPGAGTADMAGALSVAEGLARHTERGIDAVLLSDGEFGTLPTEDVKFSLRFVQIGGPVNDIAVATLSARRPPDGRSGYIAYARIENRGTTEATIEVAAMADTVPLPTRSQTVPEGGHTSLTWQVPAGTVRFTVSISPQDAVPSDDRAVLFLPSAGQYRVDVVSSQPDSYLRVLGALDGLTAVTNTTAPGAAFTIIEGTLPDPLPSGNLLLINPNGALMKPTGRVAEVRPNILDAANPLVAGIDLNALLVSDASTYEMPDWLDTVVDSSKGPLVLAGEQNGRRVVVLTFDPRRSNLSKLAAFPLFMANAADWLYPLAGAQTIAPGQPLQLAPGSSVQTPSGRTVTVEPPGLFTDTDEGGIYRVTGTGGNLLLQFAVNMADAPQEAVSVDHPELNNPVELAVGQVTSQAFWLPLAVLALALFGGEWLIYCLKRGSI
ncbi:MAG: VWA domain-containing protein [Chloroflexota bacterium]